MPSPFVHVAVPTPLRRVFTYRNLPGADELRPGTRVKVPFGRREVIGIVVSTAQQSEAPATKLKTVLAQLDSEPLWPDELWQMLNWAARYYQHPPGEVFATALPSLLKQGQPASPPLRQQWRLANDEAWHVNLTRAPRQQAILQTLREAGGHMLDDSLRRLQPNASDALKRLQQLQLVVPQTIPETDPQATDSPQPGPTLNPEQAEAVKRINAAAGHYQALVLQGVTGSGKTEVYLNAIEASLSRGEQALVLIPEIGLSPQMIRRFSERLPVAVGVLHSGLTDSERLHTWLAARDGKYPVIIGTRSAIFTPLPKPGLIIIDEEHDASFKQQDGFRYSARDLAIWRARHNDIPVVLGSATPSLETLENIQRQRYQRLTLSQRAGAARPPQLHLLDMRSQPAQEGLSERLMQLMQEHLTQDQQVLLFLNRRGFSPALMCHDCGWIARCPRCDSNMTYHHLDRRLRCHHCGSERPADTQCQQCASTELLTPGSGTERIETVLQERFADFEIIRIDRDTTRRKGSLQNLLSRVHGGRRQILIGTQMLAKGHHFPNVTMVGIIDADQGLHSPEFRAPERMAQLILQVAGRAGRAEQPGEVYIQTHHPDHPLLLTLIQNGYESFAMALLAERQCVQLPPYAAMALFRAEAVQRESPLAYLEQVKQLLLARQSEVQVMGPLPAPMARRAGRFRAQLVLSAPQRASLQQLLQAVMPQIDALRNRQVRWSLDIDPIDTY